MRHRTLYIAQLTFFIIFTPLLTFAQSECSPIGYTVLTINGIWTDETEAKQNRNALERALVVLGDFNSEPVVVDYLHNESHLGGLGDVVKAVEQGIFDKETVDDYDLTEMLTSASEKVKTQKLLIVAHSQGNFYANAFYKKSGVPADSIGVYAVATPSSFVAGGGEYLTSETDKVIAGLVRKILGRKILPPNTRIEEVAGDTGLGAGHNFAEVYLKYRGAEIVRGVEGALGKLRAGGGVGPCIPAPEQTLAHKAAGLAFAVADPAIGEVRDNLVTAGRNVAAAGRQVARAAKVAARALASVLESAPLVVETRDAGAAVALAPLPEETPPTPEPYTSILQNNGITADNSPLEGSTPPTGGRRDVETEEAGLSYAEVLKNISATNAEPPPRLTADGSALPLGPASSAGRQGGEGGGVNPIYNPIPVPTGPGGFRGGGGGGSSAEVAAAPAASASAEVATPAEDEGDSVATPAPGTIVINELAWKGTIASADDEWVELYNTTSAEVSLASTTLLAADGSPYIPLSGTIAAGQYFLIERKQTGETSEAAGSPLSDLTANLWTDFGTGLSDAGEVLTLAYFDGTATTTIDTAGFSDCADWCGKGGGANFVSMEKIASTQNGTAAASWLGNGGNTTGLRNGVARNGDIVNGTPGAKNYAAFLVNGGSDLTEGSLTLAATGSPYLVDSEWLTVASGTALTIEAGAVVKFFNTAGLKVDGALTINGTTENPAVLTSFFDDSYEGDTNRDGSSTSPQAGDWYGVEYHAGSSGSITGALVRYGGKFFNGDSETRASIALTNASPSVSNSTFEYGSRYGLLLTNASSTISNNTFRNHTTTGDSYGIVGSGGAPTISGNSFSNNSVGLFFSDSSGTFSNNTFTNNTNGAFTWGGNLKGAGRISGNGGTGNGSYNGVRLPSGNLMYADTSSVFSKNESTFPYLLPNTSEVPVGATLTAEAGSVWKFDRSPFNIYGTLAVVGTEAENVIFSSIYDNENPVPIINGTGIVLQNGSVSDFTNATLRYMKVALSYDNAPLSLENVSLEGNALGISGTASTTIAKAVNVSFINNTATSTIPLY